MRANTDRRARAHIPRGTQFIMSVMRCERRSLMIIICIVTLQRLKIAKRVTAVKRRDSLTGSNMVRSFVCLRVCVCVGRERTLCTCYPLWGNSPQSICNDSQVAISFLIKKKITKIIICIFGIYRTLSGFTQVQKRVKFLMRIPDTSGEARTNGCLHTSKLATCLCIHQRTAARWEWRETLPSNSFIPQGMVNANVRACVYA